MQNRWRIVLFLLVAFVLLPGFIGCSDFPLGKDPNSSSSSDMGSPKQGRTDTLSRALGEPVEGLPTYEERTLHHMTNRIRAGMDCGQPILECSGAPVRPLDWYHAAGVAAHWFAQHLHDAECFQHQTCCYLEEVGGVIQCDSQGYTCPGGDCDYTVDCPGTSASGRVGLFGASYSGENIAAGNSTPEATICQWLNSPGHRSNMCNSSHGSLGTGHYAGSNCYGSYWVQDFAGGPPDAGIVSGSHWPLSGDVTFGALLYFPGATSAPMTSAVVVDGICHNMVLELGDNEIGAYVATGLSLGSGCHAYWFLSEDENGTRYSYPTTGSFLMGSGCGGDYTTDQAGADCEGGSTNCTTGETQNCYFGPTGTENVGECHGGTQNCVNGTFGACSGEQTPESEVCDGLDNDCNGVVDDPCECSPGEQIPCGSSVGECQQGTQTCDNNGEFGNCIGSVGPQEEICDGLDNNCDGTTDENCIPQDASVLEDSTTQPLDAAPGIDGGSASDGSTVTPDANTTINLDRTVVGGCSCRLSSSFPPSRVDSKPIIIPTLPGLLLALLIMLPLRRKRH